MATLNRNNSNWSFEERRKINENWDILEGLANSTASGNNGLKQEVDQLKITVSQNTVRVNQVNQISNQAAVQANSASTIASEAEVKSTRAENNSNQAKMIAEGIDGKATNALTTSVSADVKSNEAILIANNSRETVEIVQGQFNQIVAEAGNNNPEVVASRTDSETGEAFVNLSQRLDQQHNRITEQLDRTNETIRYNNNVTEFVGHRGASLVAPENTVPSFLHAIRLGLKYIELDVKRTNDGVWVCFHDATVDGLTNGTGYVKDKTFEQLQALSFDAGANYQRYPNLKIPKLEDVIIICKQNNVVPFIDIRKADLPAFSDNYQSLVNLLIKYDLINAAHILSFDYDLLRDIRGLSKAVRLQYLFGISQTNLDLCNALGNCIIGADYNYLTEALVILAHNNGIAVNAYTVNNFYRVYDYVSWGVDFITSDKATALKGGI